MRNGYRFLGLAALAALSLTALAIRQGIVIKRVAKAGDVVKLRIKASFDAGGQDASFSGLITQKVTKVTDSGEFTILSTTSDTKVDIGGNEQASDQSDQSETTVYKETGEVVSTTGTVSDPDMMRRANLQTIRFPATPIQAGDTWTAETKKSNDGSVAAKASYKVEAREAVGDFDTFRIHASTKETEGDDPSTMEGTFWVDVKSGTLVKADATWTNAPLPGMPPLTLKYTLTREK